MICKGEFQVFVSPILTLSFCHLISHIVPHPAISNSMLSLLTLFPLPGPCLIQTQGPKFAQLKSSVQQFDPLPKILIAD